MSDPSVQASGTSIIAASYLRLGGRHPDVKYNAFSFVIQGRLALLRFSNTSRTQSYLCGHTSFDRFLTMYLLKQFSDSDGEKEEYNRILIE
jgi:hypothetical protein